MTVDIESLLARMTWEQKLLQLQIVWRPSAPEREARIRRGIGSAQPVRRLRGFTRVSLEPGESGTVAFRIDDDDLRFWADGVHRVLEPGDFTFTISDGAVEHRLGVRLEECA